jgi:hypothetical protein
VERLGQVAYQAGLKGSVRQQDGAVRRVQYSCACMQPAAAVVLLISRHVLHALCSAESGHKCGCHACL